MGKIIIKSNYPKDWSIEKFRRLAKELREYAKKEAKNNYKYREQNEESNKEKIYSRNNE